MKKCKGTLSGKHLKAVLDWDVVDNNYDHRNFHIAENTCEACGLIDDENLLCSFNCRWYALRKEQKEQERLSDVEDARHKKGLFSGDGNGF